ncbi:sybB [Symbiodinium natans]|uniref:SybB protein n=1 Tax=Symbiodinium natans TaxID=878477 RepID=A0A812SAQ6_9DINO|nr:sybB [Symbiodinium natans]
MGDNRRNNDAGAPDKTTEVREKVDQLKGIMQDNVKKILETHVTLESLENSSSSMSSQANKFLKQSVDLRRQIQCRNLKIKAICGTCVAALILYIAMPFIS